MVWESLRVVSDQQENNFKRSGKKSWESIQHLMKEKNQDSFLRGGPIILDTLWIKPASQDIMVFKVLPVWQEDSVALLHNAGKIRQTTACLQWIKWSCLHNPPAGREGLLSRMIPDYCILVSAWLGLKTAQSKLQEITSQRKCHLNKSKMGT